MEADMNLGLAVASGSLIVLSVCAIVCGSLLSVNHVKKQKESGTQDEKPPMTLKKALLLPFEMSAMLLSFYILKKMGQDLQEKNSEDYFDPLLPFCFSTTVRFLFDLMSPFVSLMAAPVVRSIPLHVKIPCLFDKYFTSHDILNLVFCSLVTALYIYTKNWVVGDLLAIGIAINLIVEFSINKMAIGCILLSGLVLYDVFWVFATGVMIYVAVNLPMPIKLLFPVDFLEKGVFGSKLTMIGLGDIILPGVLIAFFLRFDISLNRNSRQYFFTSIISYVLGFLVTDIVLYVFKRSQPALLYLVPSTLGVPLILALVKGDIGALFRYADYPEKQKEEIITGCSSPISMDVEETKKDS